MISLSAVSLNHDPTLLNKEAPVPHHSQFHHVVSFRTTFFWLPANVSLLRKFAAKLHLSTQRNIALLLACCLETDHCVLVGLCSVIYSYHALSMTLLLQTPANCACVFLSFYLNGSKHTKILYVYWMWSTKPTGIVLSVTRLSMSQLHSLRKPLHCTHIDTWTYVATKFTSHYSNKPSFDHP